MSRTGPRHSYGRKRYERDGYIQIWAPGHPVAMKTGYALEHRVIAWDAGMFNDPALQVHHINEDKTDNRLENFQILKPAEHSRHHAWERGEITNQYGTFPVLEHSAAAYRRGCRCSVCTQANTDYCREQRHRRRGWR